MYAHLLITRRWWHCLMSWQSARGSVPVWGQTSPATDPPLPRTLTTDPPASRCSPPAKLQNCKFNSEFILKWHVLFRIWQFCWTVSAGCWCCQPPASRTTPWRWWGRRCLLPRCRTRRCRASRTHDGLEICRFIYIKQGLGNNKIQSPVSINDINGNFNASLKVVLGILSYSG